MSHMSHVPYESRHIPPSSSSAVINRWRLCGERVRSHGTCHPAVLPSSAGAEGTVTRPDYLVNRVLTKNQKPLGKKIARKSRNSC